MDARSSALLRRALPQQAAFLLFMALLLFLPAGTIHYWQGWLFLGVFAATTIVVGIYFLLQDPALVERRMRVGPAAEQEPTQKLIVVLLLGGLLLLVLVAALDRRWHWSTVPVWLVLLAEAGIVLSFLIFVVVMRQNSYAASTVRVESGQPVISTGLYGVVRHPMYSGALLMAICIPLALGSYWSLLVLIVIVPALAWRLLDEERVLNRDLPGYADYCRDVHYHLVPGIW